MTTQNPTPQSTNPTDDWQGRVVYHPQQPDGSGGFTRYHPPQCESTRANGKPILSEADAKALLASLQGKTRTAPNFTKPLLLLLVASLALNLMMLVPEWTLALLALSLLCDIAALVLFWLPGTTLGANTFYIPTGTDDQLARRDVKIRALYNGCNANELAKHYGLSVINVMKIVRKGTAS